MPKSAIGDAVDPDTYGRMVRQSQENAARIEAEKKWADTQDKLKELQTGELSAEQRERAARLAEEAFSEYQTKLNEGASPERAKEEATGRILLEMDNQVRFESLNEFSNKIEESRKNRN